MPRQLFSDVSKQGSSIRLSIRDMPELEPNDGEVVVKVATLFALVLSFIFVFVLSWDGVVFALSCDGFYLVLR